MEPTNTALTILDQPTKDLLAQVQMAHEQATDCKGVFVHTGIKYAYYVLRAGCLLRDLKDNCPKGRFEALAASYLPDIDERTRQRYMKAYANAATQVMAIEAGTAQAQEPEDDAIEAEVVDAAPTVTTEDPRMMPLPELLRSPNFDNYFKNRRLAESLFTKMKGIIGERSITKLYRESGAIPDLKRGQGKSRGPYAKTVARRSVSHLGKAQQIAALVSALDKEEASPEVWKLLAEELGPIFNNHGYAVLVVKPGE